MGCGALPAVSHIFWATREAARCPRCFSSQERRVISKVNKSKLTKQAKTDEASTRASLGSIAGWASGSCSPQNANGEVSSSTGAAQRPQALVLSITGIGLPSITLTNATPEVLD